MATTSSELTTKLATIRAALEAHRLSAARLRGVDWFAWATCGGSNVVILTTEAGVAEVLVTADGAWVLTDEIEAGRLAAEEIPPATRSGPGRGTTRWRVRRSWTASSRAARSSATDRWSAEQPLPPSWSRRSAACCPRSWSGTGPGAGRRRGDDRGAEAGRAGLDRVATGRGRRRGALAARHRADPDAGGRRAVGCRTSATPPPPASRSARAPCWCSAAGATASTPT